MDAVTVDEGPAGASLALIVVAAGSATRMQGRDKVWIPVCGRPLVQHSISRLAPLASRLVLVCKAEDVDRANRFLDEVVGDRVPWRAVPGGRRRQDSVRNGLEAIGDESHVAVHDAARPLATSELLLRVWRAACEHGAAIPAVPVADTIKRIDGSRVMETLDRSQLWAAQTPQVFERPLLERVFADPRWELETATDEASMLEALGHSVRIETGERDNLKVTAAEDLAVVETLATESYSR